MTHPDHFSQIGGVIAPQPWMQLRRVATTSTPSVFRRYDVSGGVEKNEVLQVINVTWTNNTPLTHYVYGLVHQGGSAVSLQSRSRGYLSQWHAAKVSTAPIAAADMVEVSRFGGGADIGMGGLLGLGSDYGIHSVRSHSTSIPLMPHLTGWAAVKPGETAQGYADCRFITPFWEDTTIDGGKTNTDATVVAGELGLDLFAVPMIEPAKPRLIPSVIGTSSAVKISDPVTVPVPAGALPGDMLVAICGNQFGNASDITKPDALWAELLVVDQGWEAAHLKVFVKQVGVGDPTSYTFGNGFLAEEVVHLLVLRDAAPVGGDIDTTGWSVASTRTKWAQTGQMHVCPSMSSNGQMLLCATFFGRTDNPLDNLLGPANVVMTVPAGMVKTTDTSGISSTLSAAYLTRPPNPTAARTFTSTPRAFFSNQSINLSILVPGKQQI